MTDRQATPPGRLVPTVQRALEAGLPAVQLREKDLAARALLALAEELRELTAAYGALLFVNDRVDVAVAVGADGVHLGGDSMPVDDVRGLLPPAALVGVSTHDPDELRGCTADFAFFGPVFDTPAKRPFGPPQGLERLRAAVLAASIPVLAVGGIGVDTAAAARASGAHGIAVIRAILAAGDPGAATRALLA